MGGTEQSPAYAKMVDDCPTRRYTLAPRKGPLWWLTVGVIVAILAAMSAKVNAQPATQPIAPQFVIAVWAQPTAFFDRWKDRGVNTLFGAANDTTKPLWEAAAAAHGLSFIDYAGADVVTEAKQPGRIGFLQPDEPDLSSHVDVGGNTPTALKVTYDKCHATGQPVYLNLNGSSFDNVAYDGTPHPAKNDGSKYGHRAVSGGWMAWGDSIGFDYHLWTTGRPAQFDITRRLMDRCNDWSGGKPVFLYVETCTQGTGKPFTADDYEAQVWQAVTYASQKGYKLRGIVYFATGTAPGGSWPDKFDVTPPDVAARMKIVNAKLTAYAAGTVYATPATTQPTNADILEAILRVERKFDQHFRTP